MQAITAATKNGAIACNALKDYGTLESGKFADILAIDGDPSKDINVLCSKDNIRMVMKEGEPWVDKISAQQRPKTPGGAARVRTWVYLFAGV